MQQFGTNPNPKYAKGLSPGFQRQEVTSSQPHERDMLRLAYSGNSGSTLFEPVARQSIGTFRPDAVTCCLQYAAINRTGNDPVLIHYGPYQIHSVSMAQQGGGGSFQSDNVVGVVTPNSGQTYAPLPSAAGAQILMTNVIGQQTAIVLTDLSGNVLSDITSFYVSLVYFERV